MNFDDERKERERKEMLEEQDREKRGVFLCPNCGEETTQLHYCASCDFEGCKKCLMKFGDLYVCDINCAFTYLRVEMEEVSRREKIENEKKREDKKLIKEILYDMAMVMEKLNRLTF